MLIFGVKNEQSNDQVQQKNNTTLLRRYPGADAYFQETDGHHRITVKGSLSKSLIVFRATTSLLEYIM